MIRCGPIALALALGCEVGAIERQHGDEAIATAAGLSDADCQACHRQVARQWAQSRHHASFTNADFQRSYGREPLPFCRDCHAPARVRAEPLLATEAEALGVGCIDCHGDATTIVTGPGDEVQAPHPLTRREGFGTSTCARCHEFEFPAGSRRAGTMMQTTMREHRASAYADRSCSACHMRQRDDGGRDHAMSSTRAPEALRRALTVTARRDGNDLTVSIEPHEIGHAFPTGDLYRRLALHAELWAGDKPVAANTRYLARHFAPWRREDGSLDPAIGWPVPDDRVREPTAIRIAFDPAASGELRWWIDYERVDARDDVHPERSTIASQVRLAEGRL